MRSLKNIRASDQQKAFTITEVVVAALIFAIATAGILATATSMRKPATESSEEVTAAFLAKRILDDLRSQLDANSWIQNQTDGGPFEVDMNYTFANPPSLNVLQPVTIGPTTYTPSYTIEADSGSQARKINLKIDW